MSTADTIREQQEQAGLGLVSFFAEGGCTAKVKPYSETDWTRGEFVAGVGLKVENDAFDLTLRAIDRKTPTGPRMRGTLTMKETGEVTRVVGWKVHFESGRAALGLSVDRPMPDSIDCPF